MSVMFLEASPSTTSTSTKLKYCPYTSRHTRRNDTSYPRNLLTQFRRLLRRASSSACPQDKQTLLGIQTAIMLIFFFLTVTLALRTVYSLPSPLTFHSVPRSVSSPHTPHDVSVSQPSHRYPLTSPLLNPVFSNSSLNSSASHGPYPLQTHIDQLVGDGRTAKEALVHLYFLPSVIVNNMTQSLATTLYWKLLYIDLVHAWSIFHSHQSPNSPYTHSRATVLFIHAQNGLGNRLRALASGLALARATHRVPVVIWERDAHLTASVNQLLNISASGSDFDTILYRDLVVMDNFIPWSHIPAQHSHLKLANYMQKDGSPASTNFVMRFHPLSNSIPINIPSLTVSSLQPLRTILQQMSTVSTQHFSDPTIIQQNHHVYFKSAYVAKVSPKSLISPTQVNNQLRALVPAPAVLAITSNFSERLLQRSYGVHIRSRSLANDNVAVDNSCEYSPIGAWTTDFWRSRSQLPVFVNKMREIIRVHPDATFFLAIDNVGLAATLKATFPGKINVIERDCDDRDAQCVVYAFADLICLSKTKRIYGSNWSSFSEVAGRLSNRRVYLSGRHFGFPRKAPRIVRFWRSVTNLASQLWLRATYPYFRCRFQR